MATTPYAVAADVTTFVGAGQVLPVVAEVTRLISNAVIAIDDALVGVVYTVDVNGNPTDAATIQAFKDATCAQVEWWVSSGDELGDTSRIQSYSIEGAFVQFAAPPPRLAPKAYDILHIAGLLPAQTPVHMP